MAGRAPKYKAVRTAYLGRTYDSKAEAARAETLDQLLEAEYLTAVLPQPGTILLGDEFRRYRPDFFCVDPDGTHWYEDVKGVETPKFREIKRAWKKYGPCPLHVVRRVQRKSGDRWDIEVVEGGGGHLDTMARGDGPP
jgi:hypothetical protein